MADVPTLEARLRQVLGDLVAGRVYPDTAPDNAVFPVIIYQQSGGRDYAYVDGSLPDVEHARLQLTVHGPVRSVIRPIAIEAKRRMASQMRAEIYGSMVTLHDDVAKLYTTQQFFGCWYPQ